MRKRNHAWNGKSLVLSSLGNKFGRRPFLPARVWFEASDSVRECPRLPKRSVRLCSRSAKPWWWWPLPTAEPATGLTVPSLALKAARFVTDPAALCAVIGAHAVAELNMAISWIASEREMDKKRKQKKILTNLITHAHNSCLTANHLVSVSCFFFLFLNNWKLIYSRNLRSFSSAAIEFII